MCLFGIPFDFLFRTYRRWHDAKLKSVQNLNFQIGSIKFEIFRINFCEKYRLNHFENTFIADNPPKFDSRTTTVLEC